MGAINRSATYVQSECSLRQKIMVLQSIHTPCQRRSKRPTSTSTMAPLKACGIGSCRSSRCNFILKHRLGHTMPGNFLHRFSPAWRNSSRGKAVPKRQDLQKILLIGSGPIVIGQACEFDYSGTQACKALREEGFEVVLVNSNPATIMTDPEMADRTYVEPLTPEFVAKVIERERPDAMLPTVGGQTGLNLAVALAEDGTLDRFGVELVGAKLPAIRTAEDRNLFGAAMARIGLEMPKGFFATTAEEARAGVRVGR